MIPNPIRWCTLAAALTACGGALSRAAPPSPPAPTTALATTRPPAPIAAGTFQLTSTIGVTAGAPMPETASDGLGALREFAASPAHTLFELADPAVGTVRKALPGALARRLERTLDQEIAQATLDGVPVTAIASDVAALGDHVLTRFALHSTLVVEGGRASHRLVDLDLRPAGVAQRVPLGGLPGDVIDVTTEVTTRDGALALGDHAFALAYGAYAWRALDAEVTARYGQGLRASLGSAVRCPQIAARAAATCRARICIGHEAELTAVCERGLDEVVARTRARVEAHRLDALHLAAGAATVTDDPDAPLTAGVWTAEINAGQGLRPVPATFTATR